MGEQRIREDKQTAAQVREAEKMQRAFGDDAAKSFLKLREVPEDVARRVLEHGQRRQF
jgi:hypothetical protein